MGWFKRLMCGFCGVEEKKDFKDTFFVNDGFDFGGCDYDEKSGSIPDYFVPEFGCDLCNHVSRTNKGLRAHRIWTHKVGVVPNRTVDAYGRPLDYFG
ncbi:hypothetical protein CDAR_455821 [Caerostris darwini]|uniref:C2H2-type domain-containing protein n=1 Tax=Caerostris darwini TaxID=1538125 RepID=A0AAV4S445_9ARAC|nr:hypothetical protein CDAR_455821 [Caerostris darwini]